MRQVAALAGVSIKTVSRVINAEPNVSPDLVERVLAATRALGYQPNLTASNLRRNDGKTRTIGLLVNDISNTFASALHRRIEDVARERGVSVMASSLDEDPERERSLAMSLAARRVDGLIIVPTGPDQSYLAPEKRSGMPIVFVDRPPHYLDADCVLTDNIGGARGAVEHLLQHGHERIAYLGHLKSISTGRERLIGYQEALERAGVPLRDDYTYQDLNSESDAAAALAGLLALAEPPTAIFASQNTITIGAVRELHAQSLQHTVALVGFDEIPLADIIEPGVTQVVQDVAGLGEAAANLLFRRQDGDEGASELVVLPTQLLARGSGEIRGPATLRPPR